MKLDRIVALDIHSWGRTVHFGLRVDSAKRAESIPHLENMYAHCIEYELCCNPTLNPSNTGFQQLTLTVEGVMTTPWLDT